jgi:hypothetical protein
MDETNPVDASTGDTARSPELASSAAIPDGLPDDLPPVEPPSAGFIVQLFLIPGLIVVAVIGVWALFGKLSSSEQDWRELVQEIRSSNEHRRWRGATGLAHMLRADAEMRESGQNLAANAQIAKELTALLTELLDETSRDEELISQQSFVTRTLGWLDSYETVLPVLGRAMQPEQELIVRADAIRSVAVMSGRAAERDQPFDDPQVSELLVDLSRDKEPLIRQAVAFTLGLIPGDQIDQRLRVMAEDSDRNTRVNAALGMARRGMPDGFRIYVDVLQNVSESIDPETMEGRTPEERLSEARQRENMKLVILGNTLNALQDISGLLSPGQREQALGLCRPLADEHPEPRIRIEALNAIRTLTAGTTAD